MSEKDKVYYYSYELFKSIALQTKAQSKLFREVTNSLIKDDHPEGVINIGMDALKLCSLLESKIKRIEDSNKKKSKMKDNKLAISDSEVEDIKSMIQDIEEYEFLLSGCGISVMFH